MKKYLIISAMLSIALGASGPAFSQSASGVQDLSKPAHPEPPMLGIHWARGFRPNFLLNQAHANNGKGHGGGGGGGGGGHHKNPPPPPSPDMSYHGGKIMPNVTTESIFWGSKWTDTNFSGDKMTGLNTWYEGFSDSNYAATSDEYSGVGGQVGPVATHGTDFIDSTTASGGNSTSAILAEVCKVITSPDVTGNGYYAVYTDLPRGNAGYCAWHSYGSCHGVPVQFAFFWSLDGDPGCNPGSAVMSESQGLAALANVSAHELSEARTDPTGAGWYDSNGQENGDKCAWIFDGPSVTLSNGSVWKLQDEWSNAAYDAGTGYPNSKGQKGCIDGDAPY
jgi:hypothetical protein